MAMIKDNEGQMHNVASNAKGNAGLTTGIIGTSLAGLLALGGLGMMCNSKGNGQTSGNSQSNDMTSEDLYIERKQAQDYIDITKEYYQGRLQNQRDLADAFFDSYKRDVDNSFMLYKNQRDLFDVATKECHNNFDVLNQKITDTSFGLYKNQRDEKDALNDKISQLQSKVDIMQAIRPYQDALINAKIDKNELMSDFKLAKRTCKMIEGQLVLPNYPEVTGYSSYYPSCSCEG